MSRKPAPSSAYSRKDIAKVRSLLAADKSVEEIAEDLPCTLDTAHEMVRQVMDEEEGGVIGRRSEDVYVDFVLRSRAMIRQLDEIIPELRSSRQGNAAVGAVLAKHKILDRMIERGQDFGFIAKRPSQHELVIAKLGDRELYDTLTREMSEYRDLVGRGSGSFLEVKAEPVARGAPAFRPGAGPPALAAPATAPIEIEPVAAPEPAEPIVPVRHSPLAAPTAGVVRRKATSP